MKEIDDNQLGRKVVANFHDFCNSLEDGPDGQKVLSEDHYNIYEELRTVYQKKGDLIFYQFLNKVFDEYQVLDKLPQYLSELVSRKALST